MQVNFARAWDACISCMWTYMKYLPDCHHHRTWYMYPCACRGRPAGTDNNRAAGHQWKEGPLSSLSRASRAAYNKIATQASAIKKCISTTKGDRPICLTKTNSVYLPRRLMYLAICFTETNTMHLCCGYGNIEFTTISHALFHLISIQFNHFVLPSCSAVFSLLQHFSTNIS